MTNEERIEKLALVLYETSHDVCQTSAIREIIEDIRAERNAKEPLTCPFCESTNIAVFETRSSDWTPGACFYARCADCQFTTPLAPRQDGPLKVIQQIRELRKQTNKYDVSSCPE